MIVKKKHPAWGARTGDAWQVQGTYRVVDKSGTESESRGIGFSNAGEFEDGKFHAKIPKSSRGWLKWWWGSGSHFQILHILVVGHASTNPVPKNRPKTDAFGILLGQKLGLCDPAAVMQHETHRRPEKRVETGGYNREPSILGRFWMGRTNNNKTINDPGVPWCFLVWILQHSVPGPSNRGMLTSLWSLFSKFHRPRSSAYSWKTSVKTMENVCLCDPTPI